MIGGKANLDGNPGAELSWSVPLAAICIIFAGVGGSLEANHYKSRLGDLEQCDLAQHFGFRL